MNSVIYICVVVIKYAPSTVRRSHVHTQMCTLHKASFILTLGLAKRVTVRAGGGRGADSFPGKKERTGRGRDREKEMEMKD